MAKAVAAEEGETLKQIQQLGKALLLALVVPSHNLVIVRRSLDCGCQGFDLWDLTREVLAAIRD